MWSKPSIAAAAACGVVAFESLNQATPPASATSSMRCGGPTNDASAAADRGGVGEPGLEHEGGGGEAVGDVVGQAAPHRRDRGDLAARRHQHTVLDAVVGTVASERDVTAGCDGEVAHHLGVVGEADGDVAGALVGEDPGLRRRVGRQRAVPVEMVGGEVEPRRGGAAEALGPGQAEARALDDEGVDVEVDGGDERDVGVAGGDGAHAGGLEHGDGEQRRRRLAVGPGDGEHRPRPAGRCCSHS